MDFLPGFEGKTYAVIHADPPWRFMKYSEIDQSRSAENHYDVMSLDGIRRLPISQHAAKDCVLLLWVTDPMLKHAFSVIEAWGFEYKTVGFYVIAHPPSRMHQNHVYQMVKHPDQQ